jgi:hypothetical protein
MTEKYVTVILNQTTKLDWRPLTLAFDAGQAFVVFDDHELRPAGMLRRRSPR